MDKLFENLVEHVKDLPNGRERSLAITKLQEAQMWLIEAWRIDRES